MRQVLLDTGPLVASLDYNDAYHAWVKPLWTQVQPPFLTCESVISETCFLLNRVPGAKRAVFELLRRQIVTISFQLSDHIVPVAALLKKHSDVPMAVADACLVRMAERFDQSAVLTLDTDFRIYRKHGRGVIPLIIPDAL